jgi:GNAT superfamily N-acetyltransferase
MNADLEYIVRLHRTESDALGFIPAPSIQRRYLETRDHEWVIDHHGRRRGYLLHGPARWGKPLHIIQTCVEPDYRLRYFAAAAIQRIEEKGRLAGCTELRLRCGLDLPANAFWLALGFYLLQFAVGGRITGRTIAEYYRPIAQSLRIAPVAIFLPPTYKSPAIISSLPERS